MSKHKEVEAVERVLVIPDTHYPFSHPDHLDFLTAVKKRYKPTSVVHIGDECDMHAMSDYTHNPSGYSAGDELRTALKDLHNLYDLFPEVKSCVSNHTARPFRRAEKFGIPREYLKGYAEFLEAPKGWEWGDKWKIDGVVYEHGEGQTGKYGHLKAAEDNMQSTVIGHIHSHAGISYGANPKCLYFGMNVGCLINKDAYAFAYGKHMKAKPVLGAGIVDRSIPTFVPMILVKGGRWVGKL